MIYGIYIYHHIVYIIYRQQSNIIYDLYIYRAREARVHSFIYKNYARG